MTATDLRGQLPAKKSQLPPSGVRTCVGRFPLTGVPAVVAQRESAREAWRRSARETAAIVNPAKCRPSISVKTVAAHVGGLEKFAAHRLHLVPKERLYFTDLDSHVQCRTCAFARRLHEGPRPAEKEGERMNAAFPRFATVSV